MRSLGLCTGGLVVVVLASGFVPRQPAISGRHAAPCAAAPVAEVATASVSGTGRRVGERVFAQAYVARDASGGRTREFVLFVRGASDWHRGGPRVERTEPSAGDGVRWVIETRFDALTLVGFLYPRTGLLRIGGDDVGLDTANVFLLDHVDGVGGRPTVRAAGCMQTASPSDAIERAIVTLPAVRDFVGRPSR